MPLRMTNQFMVQIVDLGAPSLDPSGRPDARWRNGIPRTLKTTLEIEFEETDIDALEALVRSVGGYFPRRS